MLAAAVSAPPAPFPLELALLTSGAVIGVALWMHFVYGRQTRELRASEERFRALFEYALEGVYETPREGGFSRVNPAMARILGYATPAEVLRIAPEKTAGMYLSATRRTEFFEALGANDYLANFESEIRRPDGTTAWIQENVRAVRDPRGRLVYLQGFVTDITARRQAEDALRASEERFRVLFEHSPIGTVEYDYRSAIAWLDELRGSGVTELGSWLDANPDEVRAADSRVKIVGANPAALKLFGVRNFPEALSQLGRLHSPSVYAARRHVFMELWAGRTQTDGEFTVQSLDGAERHIYYRWRVPLMDGRPYYERTQFVLVDLTHLKSVEHALASERERLRVTLQAMTEGVVTTDRAGVVQFMNEAAGRMCGCTPAAAVGHALREVCILHSEHPSVVVTAPVEAALAAGRAVDLPQQTGLQTRGGSSLRVDGRCAPMHDLTGEAVGAVLVLRDVTERERLEAELLRASKLESVGVLAGGIAHDFNNLLAIVMGNLTLALLDEPTAATGGQWLREAERGTARAKELTQQLLTFAKGGEPIRTAVSLAEVVREAAEFALHGSSVRCDFALADDLRPADVDKGQIGQVVQNLVLNAIQAMPGGGAIRVSLRNERLRAKAIHNLPPGDYLRLELSDSGAGISPEHLPRIFEPFFTTKESGTGLGLATVYSIIQKHNGHVSVDSARGSGTTFRIWLPAARAPAPATTKSASPFNALTGRVLFMDDEEPIRVMTKALLERLGLQTTVTKDGGAAVREFQLAREGGRPFDLVIMDLTVPGAMGGADAMKEILKIDPKARGVVSSGYSSDPVMANYRAHGFSGMVPKPYRIADFARTIRDVMGAG